MIRLGQTTGEGEKDGNIQAPRFPLFRQFLSVWLACGLAAGILELALSTGGFPFAPLFSLLGIIWLYRQNYPKGLPSEVGGWEKVRIAIGYSFGVGIGVEIINSIFLGVAAEIFK